MPIDMSHPYGQLLATLSRRQLLDIAWKLGAVAALPMTTRLAWAQPVFKQYPFALGVASGDPWPESVVLWTRLAPEPFEGGGMPMANVEVSWQVATDRTFRNIVRSGTAMARPELGHSVHVEAEGLAPGREYFYRFRCGGETSQVGRTVTAPAPGAAVDRLRFGVCGCGHYETGYFTGYAPARRGTVRLRLPHRRLHLRRPRRRLSQSATTSASTSARRSTRSSTTAIATRSTNRIPICWRRTCRRRSS